MRTAGPLRAKHDAPSPMKATEWPARVVSATLAAWRVARETYRTYPKPPMADLESASSGRGETEAGFPNFRSVRS
jgi:hypothetical protein